MNRLKKVFKGLSFHWDPLFFRNLTLFAAAVFIWRGSWNLLDKYFFPNHFLISNVIMLLIGVFLLFIFDTEVEEDNNERKKVKRPRRNGIDFL